MSLLVILRCCVWAAIIYCEAFTVLFAMAVMGDPNSLWLLRDVLGVV